jgi:hypothetical protein
MSKLPSTVIAVLLPKVLLAQAVVSNDKMNIVYVGLRNPISVAVEGVMCKDLTIGVSNAKITDGENACNYTCIPEHEGMVKIVITAKVKGELKNFGVHMFLAKPIPSPQIYIAGLPPGRITKQKLLTEQAITWKTPNFNYAVAWSTKKAELRIKGVVYDLPNGTLTAEVKAALEAAAVDTEIFLTCIVETTNSVREERSIETVKYVIE